MQRINCLSRYGLYDAVLEASLVHVRPPPPLSSSWIRSNSFGLGRPFRASPPFIPASDLNVESTTSMGAPSLAAVASFVQTARTLQIYNWRHASDNISPVRGTSLE